HAFHPEIGRLVSGPTALKQALEKLDPKQFDTAEGLRMLNEGIFDPWSPAFAIPLKAYTDMLIIASESKIDPIVETLHGEVRKWTPWQIEHYLYNYIALKAKEAIESLPHDLQMIFEMAIRADLLIALIVAHQSYSLEKYQRDLIEDQERLIKHDPTGIQEK